MRILITSSTAPNVIEEESMIDMMFFIRKSVRKATNLILLLLLNLETSVVAIAKKRIAHDCWRKYIMLKSAAPMKERREKSGNKSTQDRLREKSIELKEKARLWGKFTRSSKKHRRQVSVLKKHAILEDNKGFENTSSANRDSKNIVSVISRTMQRPSVY